LEAAIRERVREIIEMVQEEVKAALGAGRSQRAWQSQLVPPYRRSSWEWSRACWEYLSGSNTRRIRGALEPLLRGAALSKSTVSRLEERYRS